MARILLVGDANGGGRAVLALLRPGAELEAVDSAAAAFARIARAGNGEYDLVLLTPGELGAALAASSRAGDGAGAGTGTGAGGDVLRETFEVFEDGVCLVAPDGSLEVANGIGARLYGGGLRDELEAAAREAIDRGLTADRSLSLEGRAFAVRAYPLSGRGAVLYVRDVTVERELEMGRLQAEKMASIGMLAAGVAHEINNPAAFVLGEHRGAGGAHAPHRGQAARASPTGGGAPGLPEASVRGERHLAGVEGGDGAHPPHRARPVGSFSHADDDAASLADATWPSSRR